MIGHVLIVALCAATWWFAAKALLEVFRIRRIGKRRKYFDFRGEGK